MMDSLTRVAMAQREIGLSAGEPPATRGYPPSVFALLPRLLERAGTADRGSITGLYTVLVEGDDMQDPIGDTARSILDGHVVLTRRLATAGHFPSIDVLESISRVANAVTTPEQRAAATRLRRLLAAHRDVRELVEIGAYVAGADPDADAALALMPRIDAFLRQDMDDAPRRSPHLARTAGAGAHEHLDAARPRDARGRAASARSASATAASACCTPSATRPRPRGPARGAAQPRSTRPSTRDARHASTSSSCRASCSPRWRPRVGEAEQRLDRARDRRHRRARTGGRPTRPGWRPSSTCSSERAAGPRRGAGAGPRSARSTTSSAGTLRRAAQSAGRSA